MPKDIYGPLGPHEAAVHGELSKLSVDDLLHLARNLPYDEQALTLVINRRSGSGRPDSFAKPSLFRARAYLQPGALTPDVTVKPFLKPHELRAYAAAAAQNAASKVLTQVLDMTEEKNRICKSLLALLKWIGTKDLPITHRTVKSIEDRPPLNDLGAQTGRFQSEVPKWTVAANIQHGRWVGTSWQFFDEEDDARRCYDKHLLHENVAFFRPYHHATDFPHLGAAHQWRPASEHQKPVEAPGTEKPV